MLSNVSREFLPPAMNPPLHAAYTVFGGRNRPLAALGFQEYGYDWDVRIWSTNPISFNLSLVCPACEGHVPNRECKHPLHSDRIELFNELTHDRLVGVLSRWFTPYEAITEANSLLSDLYSRLESQAPLKSGVEVLTVRLGNTYAQQDSVLWDALIRYEGGFWSMLLEDTRGPSGEVEYAIEIAPLHDCDPQVNQKGLIGPPQPCSRCGEFKHAQRSLPVPVPSFGVTNNGEWVRDLHRDSLSFLPDSLPNYVRENGWWSEDLVDHFLDEFASGLTDILHDVSMPWHKHGCTECETVG